MSTKLTGIQSTCVSGTWLKPSFLCAKDKSAAEELWPLGSAPSIPESPLMSNTLNLSRIDFSLSQPILPSGHDIQNRSEVELPEVILQGYM